MSSTVFTDQSTIIVAAFMNDVNSVIYNIIGNGTVIPATKAAARTNLGLGTMATQDASAVTITGGSITGTTFTGNITGNASGTAASITGVNPVANGGTNLSTTTAYSPVLTGTTATGTFKADLGPGTAGQVLTSAGAGAYPTWSAPSNTTAGTKVALTSGTTADSTTITGTGVKKITASIVALSGNGTSLPIAQFLVAGTPVATGYTGGTFVATATPQIAIQAASTGIPLNAAGVAAGIFHGQLEMNLADSSTNTWTWSLSMWRTDGGNSLPHFGAGSVALTGVPSAIRLTFTNGTDTFDGAAGAFFNINYHS